MRIKKRTLKFVIAIFLLCIMGYSLFAYLNKDPYSFNEDKVSYSTYRGPTEYVLKIINTTSLLDIYSINFKSKDFLEYKTLLYGLLFIPKEKKNVPGIVLLPGGGVTKESEARVAALIASWGYAVLTFDQRGIGETGGYYLSIEDDYRVFSSAKEPIQHLSIYDALKAYDVLKKIPEIDKDNIAVSGESMGGRYAIIAAAVEKRFKGAVIISSSGFHVKKDDSETSSFLLSIDPDHYIADISPRKVFMLHGTNDSTIRLGDAQHTFSLGKDPKYFFIAENCGHGYCPVMDGELHNDFIALFGK